MAKVFVVEQRLAPGKRAWEYYSAHHAEHDAAGVAVVLNARNLNKNQFRVLIYKPDRIIDLARHTARRNVKETKPCQ